MQLSEAYEYTNNNKRRRRVLTHLSQPLTAKQLARMINLTFDSCREAVRELAAIGLVRCLNEAANKSRLYWLTRQGIDCQRRIRSAQGLPEFEHGFPQVDWSLYGWVCFSHRAAVIKALTLPLQPSAIKRKARSERSSLRMSANNVRDIIHLYCDRKIVTAVQFRRRAHPRYQLTATGEDFRTLLQLADGFGTSCGGAA